MAKRTCGATDRLDQTRVPRSSDRLRQTTSASSAAFVPAVLQRHPNTSVTGQGLTGAESRPCYREHSSVAHPRRVAPPLCPDLISDSDRYRTCSWLDPVANDPMRTCLVRNSEAGKIDKVNSAGVLYHRDHCQSPVFT